MPAPARETGSVPEAVASGSTRAPRQQRVLPEEAPSATPPPLQAAPLAPPPPIEPSFVVPPLPLEPATTPAAIIRAAFEPAVEAVAEAIQVSSDLATRGEGEIRIQLKPAVLDGSTVQISVSGNDMSIVFTPATPDAAALLQAHTPELATLLAERVPAWHATVHVSKRNEHA